MRVGFSRGRAWWNEACTDQAQALDAIPPCQLPLALLAAGALTIHTAQVLSRWPTTCFPAFAWLPFLGLSACFLGLAVGYARSCRWRSTVAACLPLLAVQALLLGFCHLLPAAGQAAAVAGVVAAGNALLFIPFGHLHSRLMRRLPRRKAYALGLLGGLVGVAVSALLALLWTPPNAVWALAWLGMVPLLNGRARRPVFATVSVLVVTLGLMVPPGGQGNATGSGFIGLWPLSLGSYVAALFCTRGARRADQAAPQAAAKRAA